MSKDQLDNVIHLPHPARVAANVINLIVATQSEEDAGARRRIARTVVDLARRNGQLRREFGVGVGGISADRDAWWLAAVCLRCCWVGELTSDEDAAADDAGSHAC